MRVILIVLILCVLWPMRVNARTAEGILEQFLSDPEFQGCALKQGIDLGRLARGHWCDSVFGALFCSGTGISGVPGQEVARCFFRKKFNITFSNHDPIDGMACISVNEPSDLHGNYTWKDNYVCTEIDVGLQFSSHLPFPDRECIQIEEYAEAKVHTWYDNFLCYPEYLPITFVWSMRGIPKGIPQGHCTHWDEPSDPGMWGDNFLCWK